MDVTNEGLTLTRGSLGEQTGFLEAKESFQKNINWWGVLASFDLPDFSPTPKWIARKLGMEVEEVLDALEGLTTLGYLKKDGEAVFPSKNTDFAKLDWDNKTKAQMIDEHATVSQQILNSMHERTSFTFHHRFFVGNKEILKSLYQDIEAAFVKADAAAHKNGLSNNAIYTFSFTGVDVTSDKTIWNERN